jgi:2-polyprenyl-6-methoxyphenol hydroxylase-like FAD-dependent oxidoreductase
MTSHGSVLISGAGVAGTTAAYWLHEHGFQVTLLERAAELRATGQNIDIRGAGRQVIRHMGLQDRIAAARTGEVGIRFVDRAGRAVAEFPANTGEGQSDSATAEAEILRGELVIALDELTAGVEHVYGDRIQALSQDDTGVDVTFEHADPRRFDLLVIAEGIRSGTRTMGFGDEAVIRDLGQYTAYGAIARSPQDDSWWSWLSAGKGRAVMLRPDNVGSTRAALSFLGPAEGLDRLPAEIQLRRLRTLFADVTWQVPRILDALEADHSDFYLDRVGQVHSPTWSRGRVALVGDAAYCPSPISGMGTTLALTGAYVLANELARADDHRSALRSYETLMRPFVTRAQKLPPGAPRIANPYSRLGVQTLNTLLRLGASRPGRGLTTRLLSPPAENIELPDYAAMTR